MTASARSGGPTAPGPTGDAAPQGATGERPILSVSPPLRPPPGSDMGGRLVVGPGSGLDALDPFVALMNDDVPPWIRFPLHQHRAVEIITYALGGGLYHEDSLGNSGTVVAGGVERNLFGRGYSHSEAPVGQEHYLGLQLFILLKPEEQQLAPSFQILEPSEVPEVVDDGHRVRVIAGEYGGRRSPLTLRNPTLYLDVLLAPGAGLSLPVPADYQGLAYVLSGQGRFGTPAVPAGAAQRLVLGPGAALRVSAERPEDGAAGSAGAAEGAGEGAGALRFVLITGRPVLA